MHLTKFSSIFAPFQQTMTRKKIFRRPGGAPAPPAPPGQAYVPSCPLSSSFSLLPPFSFCSPVRTWVYILGLGLGYKCWIKFMNFGHNSDGRRVIFELKYFSSRVSHQHSTTNQCHWTKSYSMKRLHHSIRLRTAAYNTIQHERVSIYSTSISHYLQTS